MRRGRRWHRYLRDGEQVNRCVASRVLVLLLTQRVPETCLLTGLGSSGGMDHGTHHADPRVASIGDRDLIEVAFAFFAFPLERSDREETKEGDVNKMILWS